MKYIVLLNLLLGFICQSIAEEQPYAFRSKKSVQTEPKINALKFDLLAPVLQNISLTYERAILPKKSIEVGFGLIGLGFLESPKDGYWVRAGFKFMVQNHSKTSRTLAGLYIKPEIVMNAFTISSVRVTTLKTHLMVDDFFYFDQQTREITTSYNGMAGLINFGKQWDYKNRIIFDFFTGLGFAKTNKKELIRNERIETKRSNVSNYAHNYRTPSSVIDWSEFLGNGYMTDINEKIGFALHFGFRMGILIGDKK